MRTTGRSILFALAALAVLSGMLAAQERIESMKLLAPNTGWAASKSHLYWTLDNGANWKDITPKAKHPWQEISSAFFLDSAKGWVVLNCADHVRRVQGRDLPLGEYSDSKCFEIASTADSGQSWTMARLDVADPDPQSGFSGKSYIDCADETHCWIIFKIARNTATSVGIMLRSGDGGRTWKTLPRPPVAEEFRFKGSSDGWMAGGPDEQLFTTKDGGLKWQEVKVTPPKQISSDLSPVYGLPTFSDDNVGFLPVTYESSSSDGTPVALFRTQDAGKTWLLARTFPPLPDAHPWSPYPSAVVNGELIIPTIEKQQIALQISKENDSPEVHATSIGANVTSIDGVSFTSASQGWILCGTALLATTDAGRKWVDIKPGAKRTSESRATRPNVAMVTSFARSESEATITSQVSIHLGFDAWPTPPTSTMRTWWASSPFYDAGIYLYGSPNKSPNKAFYPTASWVTTVQGYG